MAENQSSEPSKPEELRDSSPEADPSSSSIEAPSEGAPKTLDSDDKSFSELLAGAIACPINSIAPASASGSGVHTVVLSLPATTTRFMQMPLDSPENFPSGQGNFEISHQQALANVTAQAARVAQKHFHGIYTPGVSDMIPSPETSGSVSVLNATPKQVIGPVVSGDSTTMPEKWQLTVSDPKFEPFHILDRPIHDVYNWRKYGQKQVKGSEYPRSYYKCTHLGCAVKKMVVCSFDGLVTEVIYKGEHSHEPPSRKRVVGFSFLGHGEGNGALDVLVDAVAGGSANGPDPSGDPNGLDPSVDPNGLDPSGDPNGPDPSGDPNGSDPSGPVPSVSRGEQGALDVLVNAAADGTANGSDPSLSRGEQSTENAPGELVLVSSNHEEDGNAGARDYEVREDEPDLKRRNTGNGIIDLVPSQRAVREPRVVVQTTSDLEILFDGYRWRKYGQKIIKGNPNPRSYYKCTSMGCPVRKHVERSSDDPKAVITTYEGKHSHDIPGSKYSIYVPHSITTAGKLPAPTTVSTTDKNPSSRESLETEIRDGGEKAQADILTSNERKNDHGGEKANANNPTEGGSGNPNAIQDGSGKAIADKPTDHDQPMELDSNSSEVDGESKNPKRKIQRLLLDENHVPVSVSIPNT